MQSSLQPTSLLHHNESKKKSIHSLRIIFVINIGLEEWDIITPADLAKAPPIANHVRNNHQFTSNFLMQQVRRIKQNEKT